MAKDKGSMDTFKKKRMERKAPNDLPFGSSAKKRRAGAKAEAKQVAKEKASIAKASKKKKPAPKKKKAKAKPKPKKDNRKARNGNKVRF